jgi:hypothetical protein
MKRIALILATTIALGACTEDTCACSYGNARPGSCARLQQVYEQHHSAMEADEHDVRITHHVLRQAAERGCGWATMRETD